MSTWDDVKKKIQDIEKDPFIDADMLRTMDTISIADYWRRRFEEEHALSEKRLLGRDDEIRLLKERVERQGIELQMAHQQLDAARTQLMDKQHYWEERHHGLELENRSLKDRSDWEIKARVLEETNKMLAERVQKGQTELEGGEDARPRRREIEAARAEAARELDEVKARLAQLQEDKRRWEEERGQFQALQRQWEAAKEAQAAGEETIQSLAKERDEARAEMARLSASAGPLGEEVERIGRLLEEREKDRFLSMEDLGRGFAHRVRNYLGIMSGTLQLCLSNYKMEEELQQQITLVDENAQEMLRAIEEFLSLVRIPEMALESMDINEMLRRSLTAMEEKVKAGNVKYSWKLAADMPPIKADSRLLGEAISAIVANALEAMPEGGRLEIETQHRADQRSVVVAFRDSGKGINESHLRKVFQPYFTSKKGHKGLGLSVVKRVVQLLRGSVSVESVKGEGASIIIALPVAA